MEKTVVKVCSVLAYVFYIYIYWCGKYFILVGNCFTQRN